MRGYKHRDVDVSTEVDTFPCHILSLILLKKLKLEFIIFSDLSV